MQTEFSKYFSINPEIRFGKPCVIGTRITVADILIWLASGMSFEEITEDFPEISHDHIIAALSYAVFREHAVKSIFYGKTAS